MSMPPALLEPLEGDHIDGLAPTFNWSGVKGTVDYQLQVADSPSFDVSVIDTPVSDATSLTLYEVLPTDGRSLYWRVRASDAQGPGDWSEPVSFVSGRQSGQRQPARTARATTPSPTRPAPVAQAADAPAYASGTTSVREMSIALIVLVVTVLIIAIGIMVSL